MAKQYARGSRAWGICGRSGRKMLLKDMVFDGRYPNLRVDPAWYEGRHPQETLPRVEDPVALYRPAPEVIAAPTSPSLTVTGGVQLAIQSITCGNSGGGPGPLGGPAAGAGWCDGTTNGGHGFGSIVQNPPELFGFTLNVIGSANGGSDVMGSPGVTIAVAGDAPQNLFTSVKFVGPSNVTFQSSAASYSTTAVSGHTCWRWPLQFINDSTGVFQVTFVAGTNVVTLTIDPAETGITEIASYDVYVSIDGAQPPQLLQNLPVVRDFLGGIIGVTGATIVPEPENPGDPWTNVVEDPVIVYEDVGEIPGHTYCYSVIANPMGNNQSNAQGPPSAPSNVACASLAPDWTFRGDIAGANEVLGIANNGAGLTLMVDLSGNVHASTDGGHTWTLRSTVPAGLIGGFGNLAFGDGVWIWGAAGASVAVSTNSGTTWSTVNVGISSAGAGWVATDGKGNWIVWGNVGGSANNFALSSNGGTSWTIPDTFTNNGAAVPPFWDGSQWVALLTSTIATSPDGTHWTASGVTNLVILTYMPLAAGGNLYVGVTGGGAAQAATTPFGVATAPQQQIANIVVAPQCILAGGGLFTIFDDGGQAFSSPDANFDWVQGLLNLAAGETVSRGGNAAFDALNGSFIAGGNAGSVVTLP